LRADLHSVQRQVGTTGIPRLTAEREGGSHADRFWALALALHAGSTPAAEYAYHSVGSREHNNDHDQRQVRITAALGAGKGLW
jgi:phage FluMu gp28-like protein